MKVLMVTGDKSFGPGHARFELQKAAVDELMVVYWGRGSVWPKIPAGAYDVVTVQDPFWRGLFAWWVARRLGTHLNVQVHTDLTAHTGMRRLLASFVLRHADSVRVVSERLNRMVEAFTRAPVTVLPVFIDIKQFKNIKRHLEPGLVLWLGRFEEEKDPLRALEIIQKVSEARLIMLGKGSLESELRKAAEGLPVEFPGWSDPLPYLARADVVLCTSRHESFGASIVEALAAGVPVVAPDVGVAKEAGAIVVPREKLAEAVVEVLQNPIRGELKLTLLSREEWQRQWRDSLY